MIFRNLEIGKKIISKRGLPAHIVLFITNRCNMACDHCFLVESGELNDVKRPQILSVENLRKLATSNPKLLALSIHFLSLERIIPFLLITAKISSSCTNKTQIALIKSGIFRNLHSVSLILIHP